jgi:hypothetical protein
MQPGKQDAPVSKMVWAGRIISALLKLPPAVEATIKLGYPANVVQPIGIVALICVLLYAIPRTSVLGAILLTGYLGGATTTQVRVRNAWFVLPVILGMFIWTGMYFRDERLRALIPLNS